MRFLVNNAEVANTTLIDFPNLLAVLANDVTITLAVSDNILLDFITAAIVASAFLLRLNVLEAIPKED